MILKPSRAGAAQRRPHRRAAARSRPARRRAQRRARRTGDGRGDLRPSRTSRRSASSARRRWRRSSTAAARRTSSACLALGGAKNHLIVMPDAEPEMTSSERRRVDVRLRRPALHGGVGDDGRRRRPITSSSAWSTIVRGDGARQAHRAGDLARGEGAHRALHRRGRSRRARRCSSTAAATRCRARKSGYYVGPTLIDHVTPDMRIAQEEVFGPVMVIVRANDVDEALDVQNALAVRQRRVASSPRAAAWRATSWRTRAPAWSASTSASPCRASRSASAAGTSRSSASATSPAAARSSSGRKAKKMTTKWNKEAGVNWMS